MFRPSHWHTRDILSVGLLMQAKQQTQFLPTDEEKHFLEWSLSEISQAKLANIVIAF